MHYAIRVLLILSIAAHPAVQLSGLARDTTPPSVLNQYVWTPVEKGMMILRDSNDGSNTPVYGVPASNLDQRVWSMQAPDGSTMQIVLEHKSNQGAMQDFTEEYVYDPSGQASIVRYNVVTTDYDFWINSVYDWRYLWRGGRAGQDQIPPRVMIQRVSPHLSCYHRAGR